MNARPIGERPKRRNDENARGGGAPRPRRDDSIRGRVARLASIAVTPARGWVEGLEGEGQRRSASGKLLALARVGASSPDDEARRPPHRSRVGPSQTTERATMGVKSVKDLMERELSGPNRESTVVRPARTPPRPSTRRAGAAVGPRFGPPPSRPPLTLLPLSPARLRPPRLAEPASRRGSLRGRHPVHAQLRRPDGHLSGSKRRSRGAGRDRTSET